jgi:hypothetical protein
LLKLWILVRPVSEQFAILARSNAQPSGEDATQHNTSALLKPLNFATSSRLAAVDSSIAVLHVHRSGILRLMGDEQDKIVPTDYVIESIKAEIEAAEPSRRRRISEAIALAALGGIPWVSAKAKMSRARNTSPAGRVRECAQRCKSSLCSGISLSKFRLSVMPDRRSKHDYVITGTLY